MHRIVSQDSTTGKPITGGTLGAPRLRPVTDTASFGRWDAAYETVREALLSDATPTFPQELEQRRDQRFSIRPKSAAVQVQLEFPVTDVCARGVGFISPTSVPVGSPLVLILEKTFGVELQVVDCSPLPAGQAEGGYTVHGAFSDADHGKKLVVMLHEMGLLTTDQP